MAEHMVPVRKAGGGCTMVGPDGETYEWPKDGSVTQVPYEWALELTRISGAGFTVVEPGEEKTEVTEPAPKGEAEVTEPEPKPKAPAAERPKARANARSQHKVGGQ